jgi:AbrB family looped-hinge helix DNA binding protein
MFPYFRDPLVSYKSAFPNPNRMPGTHFAEARLTSKAQLTLPKKVKDILGVSRGDYILFFRDDHRIYIEPGKLTVKSKK